MRYSRYAVFYVPPENAEWSRFATAWLGWDMVAGRPADPPADLPDLPDRLDRIAATPRRYGLHGTIKPPFRLAAGQDRTALEAACAAFCEHRAPVPVGALATTRLGGFLALCPVTPDPALNDLAAACVAALDPFRAPPDAQDLARRRAAGLTPRQDRNLVQWGYPHVMEDFRFHVTLTGRLPRKQALAVQEVLAARLDPLLPRTLAIRDLALVGEDPDGLFHLLGRFPLNG